MKFEAETAVECLGLSLYLQGNVLGRTVTSKQRVTTKKFAKYKSSIPFCYTSSMDAKKLSNQEKLDHMFEMVNELNHEMHEMKKKEAAEGAYRLFYMTLIIIALGGVYYFVSPLFEAIKKAPGLIDDGVQKIDQLKKNIPSPATLQQAVESATNGAVTPENVGMAKQALTAAKGAATSTSR